jgi:hypothetical protein
MDPNAALENARVAILSLAEPTDDDDEAWDMVQQLTDAFEALDGWLTKGGFLPDAWQR